MSTSLLYRGFGVRGYHLAKTEFRESQIVFHVNQPLYRCRCSVCGSGTVAPKGHQLRSFRGLPIGSKPVPIVLPIPRVECRECGSVRQVSVGFADPFELNLQIRPLETVTDVSTPFTLTGCPKCYALANA